VWLGGIFFRGRNEIEWLKTAPLAPSILFDFSHLIAVAHLFDVTKYCGEIFQGYEDSVTVLSRWDN
jgi:hypothetical protein